jgi:hypothetical protein
MLSEIECMTCNVGNHDLHIGILEPQNCSHLIVKIEDLGKNGGKEFLRSV